MPTLLTKSCLSDAPSGGVRPCLRWTPVVVLVAVLALAACVPPQPPPPRPTPAEIAAHASKPTTRSRPSAIDRHAKRTDGLRGGDLIFEDHFDRPELGEKWTVKQPGEWVLESGKLTARNVPVYDDRNKGVWLNIQLPDKVRIEFDSRSTSETGDTKCEVFARNPIHEGGYSIIFGGWNNTINTIARLGEHEANRVVQRPHVPVIKDKTYTWAIVRTDHVVRWYIDGKYMASYDDANSVRGGHFGFNNWLTQVTFDNLAIYAL